ncbi:MULTISPECIES: restriction endonuclease [unclassified Streptomyces]|uniref:restriction endonuclease n=1 Tax=unclassified Streptomyces TaxID=2593676 RepID=UPI002259C938|nr:MULTISPECIES: restriction endonuclease [unclassified Streptomyces]MCX4988813.1 restriction endonuclease [Streptomyces sp. NBC_00568]MCX5005964.1 restriction endonuclease [Streptomyces sp. NBC_00638]
MSRRSAGFVGVWAEVQRQQQRQQELEARRRRQEAQQARAHQRRAAQEYREYRQAEAQRRTEELDAQVASLQGLLASGCRAPAFRAASLMRPEQIQPFAPGPLAQPVAMPDIGQYQTQNGWTASRRAQAQAEAQARFERDWHAAQAAEAHRLRQLTSYQREYQQWADAQLADVRRHNAGVVEVSEGVRRKDPDSVIEYFSAALYSSSAWPEGFPRQIAAAYDTAARQLVLDWELPAYGVVPEVKSVRYLSGTDQDKETPRPVTQRRSLYREVLAQCALLVLHELFGADEQGALESVVLNGFVDGHDPTTGRPGQIFLTTVMVSRSSFLELHLAQVDAGSCLADGLRGQLSARPDQLTPVRPSRRPRDVGNRVVAHGGDEEPDLYAMDPIAFEELVADLFRAMGMQAVTTQRSNDGGVDVDALDPAPIRGGKIVVQVKRYRSTVPPTAVRDLYGTVQDAGANKGVLVTTSGFGPGSHAFADGKPLELIPGPELVDLLHRHGLRGRLGERGRPAAARPAPSAPPASDPGPSDDYNILGMSWTGSVALDVCALVCRGGRVLSDDHFVFFNNPRTPDGSVRALAAVAPDKAAIRVAFDGLPAEADRFVLVAAVDPEINPDSDLSGFTDAGIRLLDPDLAELDRLDVSDGRPRETALVLGSFRRRADGDWKFVLGGKGYTGGLEELVRDFGIVVD